MKTSQFQPIDCHWQIIGRVRKLKSSELSDCQRLFPHPGNPSYVIRKRFAAKVPSSDHLLKNFHRWIICWKIPLSDHLVRGDKNLRMADHSMSEHAIIVSSECMDRIACETYLSLFIHELPYFGANKCSNYELPGKWMWCKTWDVSVDCVSFPFVFSVLWYFERNNT